MVSAWLLEKYFETRQKHNNAFISNIHKNVVLHEKKSHSYLKWKVKLETTLTNQAITFPSQ